MDGARLPVRRTVRLAASLAALVAAATVLQPASGSASPAERAAKEKGSAPISGTLSSTAANTSQLSVPVPAGVTPKAITAVLTQPAVVEGGSVAFQVNGRPALTVDSSLYQKVTIPVGTADVIADGTIGLTMVTQAPAVAGELCRPPGGSAALRKIALDYKGTETLPTTVAGFFPSSAARVDVVIPAGADDDMIEAGLTAVDALAARYDDDTPIALTTTPPDATTAVASQRVVALVEGRPGEVTTSVSTTGGVPMLTLTGTGDELTNAARSLSSDALLLANGKESLDPSQELKSRNTATTRSLQNLGVAPIAITGYGQTTEQFQLRQDQFGSPVSELVLHLVGSHTAFPATAPARLDVRVNGSLVGSAQLGTGSALDVKVTIPPGKLASVNDVGLTLSALAPTGEACTPPSAPTAELDVDTADSTVTATHGTGHSEGFQLYPQVFQGTLPVAIRSSGDRRIASAEDAAQLVTALQRAAGSPLDIQLMPADAFLADKRSGLIVGAVAQDSVNLDAPLKLSATRQLDRNDSQFQITSQDPYAVLESIDRNNRLVLMLGSWAPGNGPAPAELSAKVAAAVVAEGWATLEGDLVLADSTSPAFVASSRSLKPHAEVTKDTSYAKWFVAGIAVLLLLLAFQVLVSIRRDRRVARSPREDPDPRRDGPAFIEENGEENEADSDEPVEDELGDVDDLEVTEHAPATDDPDDDEDSDETDGWDEAEDDEAEDDEADLDAEPEPGDVDPPPVTTTATRQQANRPRPRSTRRRRRRR